MSSPLSEPGGLGLRRLGFPEPVACKITAEAGFTRFTTRDFENPINAYYEVRHKQLDLRQSATELKTSRQKGDHLDRYCIFAAGLRGGQKSQYKRQIG
jgi:hypothetical protein